MSPASLATKTENQAKEFKRLIRLRDAQPADSEAWEDCNTKAESILPNVKDSKLFNQLINQH